jgi:hypothetical protein
MQQLASKQLLSELDLGLRLQLHHPPMVMHTEVVMDTHTEADTGMDTENMVTVMASESTKEDGKYFNFLVSKDN